MKLTYHQITMLIPISFFCTVFLLGSLRCELCHAQNYPIQIQIQTNLKEISNKKLLTIQGKISGRLPEKNRMGKKPNPSFVIYVGKKDYYPRIQRNGKWSKTNIPVKAGQTYIIEAIYYDAGTKEYYGHSKKKIDIKKTEGSGGQKKRKKY